MRYEEDRAPFISVLSLTGSPLSTHNLWFHLENVPTSRKQVFGVIALQLSRLLKTTLNVQVTWRFSSFHLYFSLWQCVNTIITNDSGYNKIEWTVVSIILEGKYGSWGHQSVSPATTPSLLQGVVELGCIFNLLWGAALGPPPSPPWSKLFVQNPQLMAVGENEHRLTGKLKASHFTTTDQ